MKSIPFLMIVTTLGACTPYTETFDCSPGRGVGCTSLSTINHMVEEGKLPVGGPPLGETPSGGTLLRETPVGGTPLGASPDQESRGGKEHKLSLRDSSLIKSQSSLDLNRHSYLKVWVAGYEEIIGQDRIYHDPSLIYVEEQSH